MIDLNCTLDEMNKILSTTTCVEYAKASHVFPFIDHDNRWNLQPVRSAMMLTRKRSVALFSYASSTPPVKPANEH